MIAGPFRVAGLNVRSGRPTIAALRALSIAEQIGIGLFAALLLVALVGPFLIASPTVSVGEPFASPSWHRLLGTDDIGQDILARCIYGLRTSLAAAFVVILFGVIVGGLIGLVAGARGGLTDTILMRFTDTALALPGPVLAIAVVAALGPSLTHTVIGVAVVWWPWYARLVRGEVRALAVRPHVDAARLAGVSPLRLMFRHLLPGAIPPVIVAASLDIQILVLTLAGLSFLGLGSPPPAPELGAMAARGSDYLFGHPWISLSPGIAVFLIAVAANLAGDAVRDLFERRS